MTVPISQTLEEAAEILERDGWIQHRMHAEDGGGHCALGALSLTAHANTMMMIGSSIATAQGAAAEELANYVSPPGGTRLVGGCVARWNDDVGRTQQQVLDALMGCAKRLRDEGR